MPGNENQQVGLEGVFETDKFQQGIDKYLAGMNQVTTETRNTGEAAGQAASGGLTALSVAAGTVAAEAMMSLVGSVKEATSEFFGLAVALEPTIIAFDTLTAQSYLLSGATDNVTEAWAMATGQGAELENQLDEIALSSPVTDDTLTTMFQMNMQLGMSSETAMEFAGAIGNASAVMGSAGTGMKRISTQLARMAENGEITERGMLALRRAGLDLDAVFKTQLNMTMEEVNTALASGALSFDKLASATSDYVNSAFAPGMARINQTLPGVISNFSDLRTEISENLFAGAAKEAGRGLDAIYQSALKITKSGVFEKIGTVFEVLASSAADMVSKAVPKVESFVSQVGTKLSSFAWSALQWGVNISVQFATGIIQGATAAITAAMNFISSLLGGWLSPGSPPKVAPDLDIWGESAMNEFLKGMTTADFAILGSIQQPLKGALDVMLQMGLIKGDELVQIYTDMSADIMAALDTFNETGVIDPAIFEELEAAGGPLGDELADLLRLQFDAAAAAKELAAAEDEVKAAEDRVTAAQNALTAAQERAANAGKKVNTGLLEYNQMLRSGASKEALEAKLKEINAAKEAQKIAEGDIQTAEDNIDLAEQDVDAAEERAALAREAAKAIQDQIAAQQQMINQMIELVRLQEQYKEDAAPEEPEPPGGGGGGGEIPIPEIPDIGGGGGGIGGQLDAFKKMVQDKLKDLFKPIVDMWENTVLPCWAKIQKAWETLWVAIKGIWDTYVQPIIDKVKKFFPEDFGDKFMKKWGEVIGAILPFIIIIGIIILIVTVVGAVIGSVFGSVVGVFLLVTAALAALLVLWDEGFFGMRDAIEAFFAVVVGIFTAVWTFWVSIFTAIFQFFAQIWEAVKQVWQAFSDLFKGDFAGFMEHIQNAWSILWNAVVALVTAVWDALVTYFQSIWAIVGEGVTAAWTAIKDFFSNLWDSITTKVTEIWNAIVAFFVSIWDAITSKVTEVWNSIMEFISGIWDSIKAKATEIWTSLKDWLLDLIEALFAKMGIDLDDFLKKWSKILADLKAIAVEIWSRITEWITEKITAISNVINAVLAAISAIWSSIWNTISSVATSVWNTISSVITTIVTAISTTISSIFTALASTISGIWNSISTTISGIWSSILSTVTGLVNSLVSTVTGAFSSLWSSISGYVSTFTSFGRNLIQGAIDGVLSAVGGLIDAVTNAIASAIEAAKNALGIGSPSKVFAEFGVNTIMGMEVGLTKEAKNLPALMTKSLKPMIEVPKQMVHDVTQPTRQATTNNYYNEYQLGGNQINNGMGVAQLEALILRTVKKGVSSS